MLHYHQFRLVQKTSLKQRGPTRKTRSRVIGQWGRRITRTSRQKNVWACRDDEGRERPVAGACPGAPVITQSAVAPGGTLNRRANGGVRRIRFACIRFYAFKSCPSVGTLLAICSCSTGGGLSRCY